MKSLKNTLKYKLLPKKLYLRFSALNKYRRADKKGETELRLLPFLVDPRKAAVDVGANTGLYTWFLSRLAAHVYAFEPHKLLADFLKTATADNVTVFHNALSDTNGECTLRTPLVNGKESLNIASINATTHAYADYTETTIAAITLDSLQLQDVGFIKIDVEGHEPAVLEGMADTLRRCRPVVLMEILCGKESLHDNKAVRFMRERHYDMLCLHGNVLTPVPERGNPHEGRNFIFLPRNEA